MRANVFRDKKRKSENQDAPTDVGVPFRHVLRHLVIADDGLWACYVLGAVPWAFRSAQDRAGLLDAVNVRWADLAGHRVQLRVTGHPVPYGVWAQRLHERSPDRLPDVAGAESWAECLTAQQLQIARSRLEAPAVYLLVRVTTRRVHPGDLPRLLGPDPLPAAEPEKIRQGVARVSASVARDGFAARPLSSRGVAWLTSTSIALGVPASVRSLGGATSPWSPHDLEALTAQVRVSARPYAKTV